MHAWTASNSAFVMEERVGKVEMGDLMSLLGSGGEGGGRKGRRLTPFTPGFRWPLAHQCTPSRNEKEDTCLPGPSIART